MTGNVVLTLDFAVLVNYEHGFCDASYIDKIIEKAAARNVRTILWRTLGGPRGLYRSRSVPTFEDQSPKWKALLEGIDPLEVAVERAREHGVKLFAWATLQDFNIERPGSGISNTSPFFDDRPELYWLSIDGEHYHKGIPCYAYGQAREYYLDHIREVLGYGVAGVYVCFRSHARPDPALPFEDDQYGYNEPWVGQLRTETGIDASPEHIRASAWLAYRMQKIRGASYTALLAEVRQTVGTLPVWVGVAEEPDILIAGRMEKENGDRAHLRARLDVSRWCRDGLADAVVVVASRMNPCDPSVAEIYRDTTGRFGKGLYAWLNMISHFPDTTGTIAKRTATAGELGDIVAKSQRSPIDGIVLHETADLEFSYRRALADGKIETIIEPQNDRDAQWDVLRG